MKNFIKVRIGLYPFEIRFLDREQMERSHGERCVGYCWFKQRAIDIIDDMDKISTELTIRHEIVHAILYTQGRVQQKKFDLEEVCELIAWKLPEINDVVERVMEQRYEKEN